ncbi:ribose-phosphate pyrophosphokinase [Alteromonadaceae bacterium M269]|nr:ribose-phosphate pyrophosphokinase [Alteromonadaceae bacterium M269]
MNITGYQNSGKTIPLTYDNFTFSGGEEHIRFHKVDFSIIERIEIKDRLNNASTLIRLMMTVDALRRLVGPNASIELTIPYFPYARQDRVCVEGEALGAAVMAEFINHLGFSKVTIWDAHSDVSPALIKGVVNISQSSLLKRNEQLVNRLSTGDLTLLSPDAGASKKTFKIAEALNSTQEVIQAQKARDLETGEIVKTEINGDVNGKNILITDDICDGGRTFIEIAKVLKRQGAKEVSLFVTHGIFSKGFEVFEGLIDAIYTTDSFRPAHQFSNTTQIQLNIIEM